MSLSRLSSALANFVRDPARGRHLDDFHFRCLLDDEIRDDRGVWRFRGVRRKPISIEADILGVHQALKGINVIFEEHFCNDLDLPLPWDTSSSSVQPLETPRKETQTSFQIRDSAWIYRNQQFAWRFPALMERKWWRKRRNAGSSEGLQQRCPLETVCLRKGSRSSWYSPDAIQSRNSWWQRQSCAARKWLKMASLRENRTYASLCLRMKHEQWEQHENRIELHLVITDGPTTEYWSWIALICREWTGNGSTRRSIFTISS